MTNQISEQERELRIAYMNRVRDLAMEGHVVEVDPEMAEEMGAFREDAMSDQDALDSIHDDVLHDPREGDFPDPRNRA